LIFEIIEHPAFQRLRRIKQLGLTDLVYPGALHTRFHHALGAMHLMGLALQTLRSKDHEISEEEYEAALIAILLHDVGHGPFSHALEDTLLEKIPHENISLQIMSLLNHNFEGKLDLAIAIFKNQYKRKFFHQLVSGQLDIDRLDYLKRDCYFTGVAEGAISTDRIIKMLNLYKGELVVEEKGIYNIEHFLNARRLMYWQVYLHKTTVSIEKMLIQIIKRAKFLRQTNVPLFATSELDLFLADDITLSRFKSNPVYLENFLSLDDYDLWAGIKIWAKHEDKVLSLLCRYLLDRKIFKITLDNEQFDTNYISSKADKIRKKLKLNEEEIRYFISHGSVSNAGYTSGAKINILMKNGTVMDVADASDLPNIKALSKIVKKFYVSYPKDVYLQDY
jgi:uncharacterized protein